jgi:hypothetical protein
VSAGVCRVCGCSNNAPCFTGLVGVTYSTRQIEQLADEQLEAMELVPCSWVEPDLCSCCVVNPPPPLLFDAAGVPLRGSP